MSHVNQPSRTGEEVLAEQMAGFADFLASRLPGDNQMRAKLGLVSRQRPEEFMLYVGQFLYPHRDDLAEWIKSKVVEYRVDLSALPPDTLPKLVGYLRYFLAFYLAQTRAG